MPSAFLPLPLTPPTPQDITTDGFGFMLAVGDLLWVPFTYSTTARYLALHPVDIGLVGTAGILAVQLIGYTIFRGSNNEKNEFRKGNNPKSELFDAQNKTSSSRADRIPVDRPHFAAN